MDTSIPSRNEVESSEYDNPWESAANDYEYRSNTFVSDDELVSAVSSPESISGTDSTPSKFRVYCLKLFCFVDVFTSLLLLLSIFLLFKENPSRHKSTVLISCIVFLAILALILLLRCIFVRYKFYRTSRVWVILLYSILLGLFSFSHCLKIPYVENPKVLPGIFLGFLGLELLQWLILIRFHYLDMEANELISLRRQHNRSNSPWWLQRSPRRSNVDEPLLNGQPAWTSNNYSRDYSINEGISRSSSSWWPFGRSSNNNNNTTQGRDDGSVEYASLNEDWASRSEADPFWWTNEDDEE